MADRTSQGAPRGASKAAARQGAEFGCTSTRCRRADGDGVRRRRAEPGSRLCAPCGHGLLRDLAALPALHGDSEQHLESGFRAGLTERVSGSREDTLPVRSGVLEARHDGVVLLSSWARLVVDEVPSVTAPRRTVADMADFLSRHADWLAAHPAAGHLADEIARVTAALRRLTAPRQAELVPLGPCVEPGCTAQVSLPRGGGSALVLRGPMCGAGHVLTPRQWLALREAV